MACDGFPDPARAALAERDLDGGIAVLLRGLDLGDRLSDTSSPSPATHAVVGEDPRHADLAADQSIVIPSSFRLPGDFLLRRQLQLAGTSVALRAALIT